MLRENHYDPWLDYRLGIGTGGKAIGAGGA